MNKRSSINWVKRFAILFVIFALSIYLLISVFNDRHNQKYIHEVASSINMRKYYFPVLEGDNIFILERDPFEPHKNKKDLEVFNTKKQTISLKASPPDIPDTTSYNRDIDKVVPLKDGRIFILFLGADISGNPKWSQLYNPVTDRYSAGLNSINPSVRGQSLTVDNENRVIIAGGIHYTKDFQPDIQAFDPVKNTFEPIGHLVENREDQTAVLLKNNQILFLSGYGYQKHEHLLLPSAEIFNLNTNTSKTVGSIHIPRANFFALMLKNNKILVLGGDDISWGAVQEVELFDPGSGQAKIVNTVPFKEHISSAHLTSDNKVLLTTDRDLYLYDPEKNRFMRIKRFNGTGFNSTVLSPDDQLYLVGNRKIIVFDYRSYTKNERV